MSANGSTSAKKSLVLPLILIVFAVVALTFLVWRSANTEEPAANNANSVNDSSLCVKSGCSGQICADEGSDIITTCEIQDWYDCLSLTKCEKQKSGKCGWTENTAYLNCLKEKKK